MIKLLGQNLSILYFFHITLVIILSFGLLPNYYSWITVILAVYFFYKEPLQNCFYFFICLIPFFIATPIFSLESLSLWRPLSLLLLIKYLIENYFINKSFNYKNILIEFKDKIFKGKNLIKNFNNEFFFLAIFFIISSMGILFATDKIALIKTVLYYFNIALIGIIAFDIIKSEDIFKQTLKSLIISILAILIVAIIQQILVFFITLNQFWEFWAKGPILIYYGNQTSNHLLISNTWFSYWPGDFASLRAFSIFQDSHSLGLFLTLGLVSLLYLYFNEIKQKVSLIGLNLPIFSFIFITALFIILSGTRGLWVSFYIFLIPIAIILIYLFKNKLFIAIKKDILKIVAIFTFCFFIASSIWFLQIYFQNSMTPTKDILLAFKRIKSSFDVEETSNQGRLMIWVKSIENVIKNPIFGVGSGNFPVALDEKISNAKKGASAHNLYLQFLVENGILGFSAIILFFYKILLKSYLQLNKKNKYALAFFIVFIWVLGYNLFDVALLNDKVLIVFTILIVLLYRSPLFASKLKMATS